MKKLIHKLKEPFPIQKKPKKNFILFLGVGAFITLFLFIFRPFGLSRVTEGIFIICLCFGLITVIFGFTFDLFSTYILKIKTDIPTWTLGKWIIQSTFLLCWIAFGNFLLMNVLDSSTILNPIFLLIMIGNTIIVGIFPILFSGLMTQMNAIKKNQTEAASINLSNHSNSLPSQTKIYLPIDNEKKIDSASVLYIEAQQNYISIYYTKNGKTKNELIRSTISKIELKLENSTLIRCHRSYMININHIENIKGNAQGLKVSMVNIKSFEVPISRSYIPKFKSSLPEVRNDT